jgi:tetratricopeptide (TPR) repeat protein
MYTNDDLLDHIERFIRGEMSPADQVDFEKKIACDPELAETVDLIRLEQQSIGLLFQKELKHKLDALEKDAPMAALVKRSPFNYNIFFGLMAALILLLVLGGIWRFGSTTIEKNLPTAPMQQGFPLDSAAIKDTIKVKPFPKEVPDAGPKKSKTDANMMASLNAAANKIRQKNYITPSDIKSPVLMSGTKTDLPQTALERGVAWYKTGSNYEDAIMAFGKISAKDHPVQYEIAQKFIAHAYYQIGDKTNDFSKAISFFQAIIDKNVQDIDQDEAEFYLLLCLLPSYSEEQTTIDALLKKMTDPNPANRHAFRPEALKVKKDIQQLLNQ